jgi:hypothetical protein
MLARLQHGHGGLAVQMVGRGDGDGVNRAGGDLRKARDPAAANLLGQRAGAPLVAPNERVIQTLAKAAVTALIKSDPSILAVEGAKVAFDKLFGWLPQRGKLEALITRVEGELEQLAKSELKGRADLEPAISNATILFEKFGLTATELVDLSPRPDRATEELLTRGKEVLRTAGEAVAGLCRGRIVPRAYQLLLDDPQTIAELSPAVTRALLGQRDAIEKIPDE